MKLRGCWNQISSTPQPQPQKPTWAKVCTKPNYLRNDKRHGRTHFLLPRWQGDRRRRGRRRMSRRNRITGLIATADATNGVPPPSLVYVQEEDEAQNTDARKGAQQGTSSATCNQKISSRKLIEL